MKYPLFSMMRYIGEQSGRLIVSTVLRMINIFGGVALFAMSGYLLFDAVIASTIPGTQFWWIFIAIGLIKAAARYGEQIIGHVAAFSILDDLRTRIFHAYSERDAETLSNDATGDLAIRAMGDVDLIEIFYAHTLAPAVSAVVFIMVATLGTTAIVSNTTGIALLALYVFAGVAIPLLYQAVSVRAGAKLKQYRSLLSSEITEALAGTQDIRAFAATEAEVQRHRNLAQKADVLNGRLQILNASRDILVDAALIASLLIVVKGAMGTTVEGSPLVWALVCGLAGGFPAILGINRAIDDLPKSRAAAVRILEVLDQAPIYQSTQPSIQQPTPEHAPAPQIHENLQDMVIDGATYRYSNGRGIENISLRIPAGSHLLITGPSGSGKTTLASALLGLLRPQEGSITLGDIPVCDIAPETRFSIMSAARQNLRLVRGTVLENIRLGVTEEGGDIPQSAMEIPGMEDVFALLSNGGETLVSGTDEQLSGGQKKRVGLAAAIARQPDILVLDEAFAGLDDEIRHEIRGSILSWAANRGSTVIELSHDPADAREADNIAVIEEGRLIEQGNYMQLIQMEGRFWDVHSAWSSEG